MTGGVIDIALAVFICASVLLISIFLMERK